MAVGVESDCGDSKGRDPSRASLFAQQGCGNTYGIVLRFTLRTFPLGFVCLELVLFL
ncbi:hypothetical protein ARMSODRAFT_959546 [Armillaria solidipes]|uniref:Uncharacterized protein n=1 Tax=Armillaria solidipes TaxID=1076256 RepID=A0A2H3BB24_9AGAR|nr:hypothetical protein ARMSODRAFT_959546 [Armillaria solidipes]